MAREHKLKHGRSSRMEAPRELPSRLNVLGSRIADTSLAALAGLVIRRAREGSRLTVAAVALHGVTVAYGDPRFRSRLETFDVLPPDGAPVAVAARWLHRGRSVERIPGPDLSAEVLRLAAASGQSVFFFGSTQATLDSVRVRLARAVPELEIAGTRPSRFRRTTAAEEEELQVEIRESGARILFVGLGCPRQEIWVYENAHALDMPILAVGAAFDFVAGTVRRAPMWMRRRGLEWAFRIGSEPKRLLGRYLQTGPRFAAACIRQRVTGLPEHLPLGPAEIGIERYG